MLEPVLLLAFLVAVEHFSALTRHVLPRFQPTVGTQRCRHSAFDTAMTSSLVNGPVGVLALPVAVVHLATGTLPQADGVFTAVGTHSRGLLH